MIVFDDCGSTYPLIASSVAYGMTGSHNFCLFTTIIEISVVDGTSCDHVMFVACTPNVGGTATNLLVSITYKSFDWCLCGDTITHRVIHPSVPQGSNSYGGIPEITSVAVMIGECVTFPCFRQYPFT